MDADTGLIDHLAATCTVPYLAALFIDMPYRHMHTLYCDYDSKKDTSWG